MDWEKIKNFIVDHKQYAIAIVVIIGILLWAKKDKEKNEDYLDDFTGERQEEVRHANMEKQNKVKNTSNNNSDKVKPNQDSKPQEVTCDISGAVKNQGVYTLKNGARLNDLIETAGGPTRNAELKKVNRAMILHDQDKIHIPYNGEKIKAAEIVSSVGASANNSAMVPVENAPDAQTNGAKVNLNTASEQELQTLNGIGEKKAQQIIAYRQKNGQFKKIEDLKQVSGIGDKTFETLKGQLEV